MWTHPITYDVIVVGAGHAGCEAAYCSASMGASVLMLTSNLDTIAKLSCNPAIGGIGKGHIVREIDALGGVMAQVTDQSGIQFRILNQTKGPAVRAPRAQVDKQFYHIHMKRLLEEVPGLHIMQGTVESLLEKEGVITGVTTKEGLVYLGKTVVLSSGTFMRGLIHIGDRNFSGGRLGDPASIGLSEDLKKRGFPISRLKTGTPPRLLASSIDFSGMEEQPGDEGVCFVHRNQPFSPPLPQVSCFITHTTAKTKEIIAENLHRSALYGGLIQGTGPRYCPSIEDKVVKFSDKERHHIFLEPEGIHTQEVYVNGLSTSMPFDVQYDMIHSVLGLENAIITRPAYAIEYDYIHGNVIHSTLESKLIEGLFLCGQINGTTGYEEAAAQGLVAGINAVNKVFNKQPFIPSRQESYIGVMLDDLTTQILDEPYRMFTGRAEHRLLLRQDNACARLSHYGYELGLLSKERYQLIKEQNQILQEEKVRLQKTFKKYGDSVVSLAKVLCRPEVSYDVLRETFPDDVRDLGVILNASLEMEIKYSGYIDRQKILIENLEKAESLLIPENLDYKKITALSLEAKEKLAKFTPRTLGSASRISGIASADIQVLMVALKKHAHP
ncbi:Glucose-inhibited division protein A,tRNA uridine 5-carboxymethylaminomethyl modification enzyme GidA,Proteins involved in synaptic transmission and general secretion, Sec1 family,tRNA uridine 5-carboxymethylaminomethyl modification enzyme GidA,Glucose inhibited division protein A [Chlamydia serpentis]|uniref:tRNA uridine 5-carboxymethylaminomethyl modification enzyme MnmG n=1 Tax=Chlamydia serpentis TaxID=1967782 RepID=A0A2R8FBU8_9CHLA|nr:tRNA uridine-5-carboxymethylaminomethyl(34) synthesis enzyme MnmG [Chlamydia serpentis]SPN73737.1 Glucose-inhibited division protein A,tRNA uridine 5-carboxymethylaminomethyl modification enzyme GidA,Proteins involved in synaptic transmission and general secretion, Sec1 family,tRNA uridine 5-carboxymethylaminomethyl modification enzyme GidA,Glucose inhibited division protein A [Chlamydia serpentis]